MKDLEYFPPEEGVEYSPERPKDFDSMTTNQVYEIMKTTKRSIFVIKVQDGWIYTTVVAGNISQIFVQDNDYIMSIENSMIKFQTIAKEQSDLINAQNDTMTKQHDRIKELEDMLVSEGLATRTTVVDLPDIELPPGVTEETMYIQNKPSSIKPMFAGVPDDEGISYGEMRARQENAIEAAVAAGGKDHLDEMVDKLNLAKNEGEKRQIIDDFTNKYG
jgi:hypothetical protein